MDYFKLRLAVLLSIIALMIYQLFDNYIYIGTLASCVASVIWLDLLMDRIIDWTGLLLLSTSSPRYRLIEAVGHLTSEQIALIHDMNFVVNGKILTKNDDAKISYYLVGFNGIDIPLEWLWDYLEKCGDTYPSFIPSRSYSDGSRDRLFTQSFIKLMSNNGFATPPIGNKPAKWLVPLSYIYDLFE